MTHRATIAVVPCPDGNSEMFHVQVNGKLFTQEDGMYNRPWCKPLNEANEKMFDLRRSLAGEAERAQPSEPAAQAVAGERGDELAKLKAGLDDIQASVLLIPGMLSELGDLDDDGGEPEYYLNHPLANIVSNIRAHCLGTSISIDQLLGRDPFGEAAAPAAAPTTIDEQFSGMAMDESYRTEALKLAGDKPFLRFERDPNNGAKLHAVFLGDRALHHFRADQNVSAYMADVQRNLDVYVKAAAPISPPSASEAEGGQDWADSAAERIFNLFNNASYFSTRNAEHRKQMLSGWAEIIRAAHPVSSPEKGQR